MSGYSTKAEDNLASGKELNAPNDQNSALEVPNEWDLGGIAARAGMLSRFSASTTKASAGMISTHIGVSQTISNLSEKNASFVKNLQIAGKILFVTGLFCGLYDVACERTPFSAMKFIASFGTATAISMTIAKSVTATALALPIAAPIAIAGAAICVGTLGYLGWSNAGKAMNYIRPTVKTIAPIFCERIPNVEFFVELPLKIWNFSRRAVS